MRIVESHLLLLTVAVYLAGFSSAPDARGQNNYGRSGYGQNGYGQTNYGPNGYDPRRLVQANPEQLPYPKQPLAATSQGPLDGGPKLRDSSWTYVPPRQPRKFAKHDSIFIMVSETAQSSSESDVQRRKNSIFDAVLQDWVMLRGLFTLKPAPQSDGDPRARGQLNQTLRAENDLESRESIQLKITAQVADILPNGHIVLEAHRQLRVNNETFEVSLSGVCDPEDIAADRSVRSERIMNLMLERRNRGHTRDAVRRGWMTRFMDTFNPF